MKIEKRNNQFVFSFDKLYRFLVPLILLHLLVFGLQCKSPAISIDPKTSKTPETTKISNSMIRYAALGDSYTIGEAVEEEERWPNLMVEHLKEAGVEIKIVANPSVTGWTTQDLIEKELPVYKASDPHFATLLIGVNDWVQGFTKDQFRENMVYIMDEMLKDLSSNNQLVIVTIPDFGATPEGPKYGKGRDISAGLAAFNVIITEEADRRDLSVVDIFEVSQGMKDDPELVGPDGLHPSAKEYALWEELILPVVKEKLI